MIARVANNKRGFVYKSELTVSCESNARNRNYMGLAMSVLVLLLISSMIVAAIVIINPDIVNLSAKSLGPREAITLDEYLSGELSPNHFWANWLTKPDADGIVRDELLFEEAANLNVLTMATVGEQQRSPTTNGLNNATSNEPVVWQRPAPFRPQTVTTLVSNSSLLASVEYQGFKLSPSRRYLLIWTAKRHRFRHSFTARYYLYDLKQDQILMLSTKQQSAIDLSGQRQTENLPKHNTYESIDSATHYLQQNALDQHDEANRFARFQLVDWFAAPGGGQQQQQRDSLILVQDNDIYAVTDVASPLLSDNNGQQHISPVRLTFTGKPEEMFNGIPDWLYEEEILGAGPAFQVSPNADTLAYMAFNDSLVESMPYTMYGSAEQVIPKIQRIKYPKVGRVNPRVSVHLVDNLALVNSQPIDTQLVLPDDLANKQHYIYKIRWLTNDHLAIVWLNRHQNESFVVVCERQLSWTCQKNLHQTASDGWLEPSDDLTPLDNKHYLAIMPKYEGPEVGSFKHIALVSLERANTYAYLTSGRKEVLQINGLDKANSLVYYSSTVEGEPGQRQMFAADLRTITTATGASKSRNVCVTCDHYPSECLYNYAKLSPSASYYIFECDGPGVPRIELRTTKPKVEPLPVPLELRETSQQQQQATMLPLDTQPADRKSLANLLKGSTEAAYPQRLAPKDSTLLWVIESNQALKDKLQHQKATPLTMRLKVPIANTNYSADVILLLPPELGSSTAFRPSPASAAALMSQQSARSGRARPRRGALPVASAGLDRPVHAHFTPESIGEYMSQLASGQQYPMVVDVYGGPGSQKCDYRFHIGYGHHLASARRTIYAVIDGRGSGNQGTKRLFELYHKFGTVEIQDQIQVTNQLTRNYSFIDSSKVAIWGWSYGGYAAAMALAKSNAQALRDFKNRLSALQLTTSNQSANKAPILHTNHKASLDGVFECAVSVAPVTNWIYYDTAYTERYMSSPYLNELYDVDQKGDHNPSATLMMAPSPLSLHHVTNSSLIASAGNKWVPLTHRAAIVYPQAAGHASGTSPASFHNAAERNHSLIMSRMSSLDLNDRYRQASLLEHIGDIDRKRFLLIHGTADDNVHFQQSVMLMKKLIGKNIMFETRVYPDQDHEIGNKADRTHLYSTLSNFFAECFDMAY